MHRNLAHALDITVPAGVSAEVPVVLDVEASGFGAGSYPIELAVAMPDGQLFEWLVRPQPHWTHWQSQAEGLHGISREQLLSEGRPLKSIALELNEILAGNIPVFSDCWGIDFGWLALLFDEAGVAQRFKLDSIFRLLTESEMMYWGEMRLAILQQSGRVPHRAAADALTTQETYCYAKGAD